MPLASDPTVTIIGAGAAGIAAGRALRASGISCLILEARTRVGGRAWTVPHGEQAPLDLGCEWLHSADRNILAAIARDTGFTLDPSEPPWQRPAHQSNFTAEDGRAFQAAHAAFEARLGAATAVANRTGRDRPAADFLQPGERWNALIDAISTYYNGAPLARVSILDYDRYVDTDVNWRVDGGYGALIAALGEGLPMRLSCRVTAIDARGRSLAVETEAGTIATEAVIVTVPTAVLASGAIAFRPSLDDHMAAAASLPLGVADKLYLTLDHPEAFEPDTRIVGAIDRRDAGSYTLRPRGRSLIEGYFGGDHARALEQGGLAAFLDAARAEIGAALGSDFARSLKPVLATRWAEDPLALGSYSHALPGEADARARLATPVDQRIHFAGEATSPHFFSTAHGAYESGLAAAEAIALSLRKRGSNKSEMGHGQTC